MLFDVPSHLVSQSRNAEDWWVKQQIDSLLLQTIHSSQVRLSLDQQTFTEDISPSGSARAVSALLQHLFEGLLKGPAE